MAGTLVHTGQGLVPIEKLRVADLVLSRSQDGGPAAYQPVVNTYVLDDQETYLVEYLILEEPLARHFVATLDQRFRVPDIGWKTVQELDYGYAFDTIDGRENTFIIALRLFQTEVADVGYTYEGNRDKGPTIDLRNASIKVSPQGADTYNDFAFRHQVRFRRRVYNIEVAQTHTYYVGEPGVWVHDASGGDP